MMWELFRLNSTFKVICFGKERLVSCLQGGYLQVSVKKTTSKSNTIFFSLLEYSRSHRRQLARTTRNVIFGHATEWFSKVF